LLKIDTVALIKRVIAVIGFFDSNSIAEDAAGAVNCAMSCVKDDDDIAVLNAPVFV
jgi:hypothetical protein